MRIAYLSTFYPFRGGIAQFNALLYEQLAISNEIRAFTFKRQYPDFLFPGTSQYVSETDVVKKIDALEILDSINPFTYYRTAEEIKRFNPDLIITKFWMPFFAPSLGYICGKVRKSGVKSISILDNVIPHERRFGDLFLTRYFLERNDGFVVMSDAVKNDLLNLKPGANYIKHFHPIFNHFGNKVEKNLAREILGIPLDKKVLLFFGFIRDYKGLDVLLEAISKLSDEYLLVIAGEVYGDFDKYDSIIADLTIENRIKKFIRYVDDKEVPLFFSASDVCVQPYKSATQSGIVGISFHFELPIIATDVGGLREIIEEYHTGIVVEQAHSELIKDAVIEFFSGDSNIFKDNIRRFKEICSWKSFAENLLKLYQSL